VYHQDLSNSNEERNLGSKSALLLNLEMSKVNQQPTLARHGMAGQLSNLNGSLSMENQDPSCRRTACVPFPSSSYHTCFGELPS